MNCRLTFQKDKFICLVDFNNRIIPKRAGFLWCPINKEWYCYEHTVAARLRDYADVNAKREISKKLLTVSPWTGPLTVPFDLTLMSHQVTAIQFALSRNKSYLGLDPGLGKTICAAAIAATLKRKFVYICPPFATRNTENEFKRWAPDIALRRLDDTGKPRDVIGLVVPDSIIARDETQDAIRKHVCGESEPILFIDEAHRFKNDSALRSKAVFKILDGFSKQIFMSGTPMPNLPMELYSILSNTVPETIDYMTKFEYGRKYCAGHRDLWGWKFDGASNMEILRDKVIAPKGNFMLRQKKHLLNLPPKLEELFVISGNMTPKLATLDTKIGEKYKSQTDLIRQDIEAENGELHDATYRRLLGLEKVSYAVTYLKSLMDETEENILVFAHHRGVIEKLVKGLDVYNPFFITGDTPMSERQRLVTAYQSQKHPRLFIGNYQSMGTAFTLTKATRVIFVEFDWVPGINSQASDRAHRIGTTSSVYVQYFVYANSYDKLILEANLKKKRAQKYV